MDPMMLNSISKIFPADIKPSTQEISKNGANDFHKTLTEFISQVNDSQKNADIAIEKTVFNEGGDIAETVIALEKAKISFQLMVNIRNSLLQSYQEIMRMQI